MALLAEEIVEEWLNRRGYFTIRGIKLGVHEIDLLAVKLTDKGPDCRHIEVTASVNPVSYITDVPKAIQKSTGRKPKSQKFRSTEELRIGVQEWIEKKFNLERKRQLRQELFQGNWSFELVVHKYKHPEEVALIEEAGIIIYQLQDVVRELASEETVIASASGASLVELVMLEMDV